MQNVAVAVAIVAAVAILAVDVDVVLVAVLLQLLLLLLRHALPLSALMRRLLLELEEVAPLVVRYSRVAVSTVVGSRVEAVNAGEDWLIHWAIPIRNRSAATVDLADCAPTPLGNQLEQLLQLFRLHCCCYSAGR